jgi:molecular chaperone DnaJ
VFRVSGHGAPIINSGKKGDLYVTVRVVTPSKLTKKETELLKELAKLRGESVSVNGSFWDSIKESFS